METTIRIHYRLTTATHRALVLAGEQSTRERTIEVSLPLPEAVTRQLATIHDDGSVSSPIWQAYRPRAEVASDGTIALRWESFSVRDVEQDHVLTSDEALALLRSSYTWRDEARAAVAEEAASKLAAITAKRAERLDVLRAVIAGERETRDADTYPADWIAVAYPAGATRITRQDVGSEAWDRSGAVEFARGWLATKERQDAERAATATAARDAWIAEHGSERLRKCVALGVENYRGIYLDERLAHDMPGYAWDVDWKESDIRNPSLAALAALEEARKISADAYLVKVRVPADEDSYDEPSWQEAVRVDDLFGGSNIAYRVID